MTAAAQPRRPLGTLAADGLLLTAAVIWGTTFIAQKLATPHCGPLLFIGIRYSAGALILLPIALARLRRLGAAARRAAISGGCLAGVFMALGSGLQQVGMHSTTASNAGFITGLYVIMVPLLGLFLGQRVGWTVWTGAALAVVGLFFLSMFDPSGGTVAMGEGDLWVLGCALAWAFHVQAIGRAAPDCDPFAVSMVQFAFTGIAGLAASQLVAWRFAGEPWGSREAFDLAGLVAASGPIAYATLLSTCVAFTLQVVAQGSAPPAHAAILLGLEGVFAALTEAALVAAGWSGLGAPLTRWKVLGCVLMFAGALLSQVRMRPRPAA